MQQDEFLAKVQNYGGLDDQEEALRMTEIFLATLGEWLYRTEERKLSAQLPKQFQDFVYRQQDPEQTRGDTVHLPPEDFYNRIKGRANLSYQEAVRISKAVARVLEEAVSPGEIEDVLEELPHGFKELFTTQT